MDHQILKHFWKLKLKPKGS